MPTFATGRTRQVTITGKVRVRLYARYFPIPMGQAQEIGNASYGYFAWPGPEYSGSNFASVHVALVTLMGGQIGYPITLKLGSSTQTVDVPGGSGSGGYDFTADVPFTLTATLEEMKTITDLGTYPGGIQDFTTETHLEYFERFTGQATLSAGGQTLQANLMNELHWTNGYNITLHGEDHRRVTWNNNNPYQPYTYNSQINSTPQQPSVLVSAEASFSPLYHTEAERTCSSGWWHGKIERVTSPSPESKLYFDNPQVSLTGTMGAGFEVTAKSRLEAAPKLIWDLEGNLRQWDEDYAGVVVDDLRNANTLTADSQGKVTRHYEAERFSWFITDNWNHGDLIETSVNQLGPDKYRLNAGWITANEEDASDWRIVLDDDKPFDSFSLRHEASLILDNLDGAGWAVSTGSATITNDAPNGMKVEVTADDTRISKLVTKRLTHYRYLRLRLKANAELVPVRVWMGIRYWDVLIEAADTVEEKIIDLCASHNAQTFADIGGIGDITEIAFDGLASDITYWFSDLTLVRQESALATLLPQFQTTEFQDGKRVLTVEIDRKLSLKGQYGQTLASLIEYIAPSGNGSGYVLTPANSTHSYYNNDRDAAYLYLPNPFDQSVAVDTLFKALPRFDRIALYPGIGDPTQPTHTGNFVVRFTKIVQGRLDGLVFIRDLSPPNTLTTRMRVKRDSTILDTQTTDTRRFYRTIRLKAGTLNVERIDEAGVAGLSQTTALVNRRIMRVDGRARVTDRITGQALGSATVAGYTEDSIMLLSWGSSVSSSAGLYGVGGLGSATALIYAVPVGYSTRPYENMPTVDGAIIDIELTCVLFGSIAGQVNDELGQPVQAAGVWATDKNALYSGGNNALTAADGSYVIPDLDADANSTPGQTTYEVTGYIFGRLAGMIPSVTVNSNAQSMAPVIVLASGGKVTGHIVDGLGATVPGATVGLRQVDGNLAFANSVESNSNGDFELLGVEVYGQYELTVIADGFTLHDELVSLGPGDTVDRPITLQESARIYGTVTHAGQPVSDADVSALQVGTNEAGFSHAVSSVDGTYALEDLDAKSAGDPSSAIYQVEVVATGYPQVTQSVTVHPGDDVLLNIQV